MCEGSDADPSAQAWIIRMCLLYMLDGLVWGACIYTVGCSWKYEQLRCSHAVQQILSAVWRNPKASEHCIWFRSRDFISWKQQKKSSHKYGKLKGLLMPDKNLFIIRLLKRKKIIFMRIDSADEERPGLDLCAEFICVKVAILIDRRPRCDCRLSWWIRFIMLWSLGMSYYRTAS